MNPETSKHSQNQPIPSSDPNKTPCVTKKGLLGLDVRAEAAPDVKFPEITYLEWRILALVNEKIKATTETITHLIYGNQSARNRTEDLLDGLCEQGLVWNMGRFEKYRWSTSELGDIYCEHAMKPAPALHT